MRPLELANKYMEIFYSGNQIDDLRQLFSNDFSFKGPFYEFDTAEAYIESLKAEPPAGFEYSIYQSYENESSACLIYQFSKPGVSVLMAQQFEIKNGRISRIFLIFDTAAFA